MTADHAAWVRVGKLLTSAWTAADYPSREALARELGLASRVLADLAAGRRTNYSPRTLALAERGARWAPGSIDRVLDGGDPIPLTKQSRGGEFLLVPVLVPDELAKRLTGPQMAVAADATPEEIAEAQASVIEQMRRIVAEHDAQRDTERDNE